MLTVGQTTGEKDHENISAYKNGETTRIFHNFVRLARSFMFENGGLRASSDLH